MAIEDSQWGIQSAKAAGLSCIAVTTSHEAGELGAADLVVPTVDALTLQRGRGAGGARMISKTRSGSSSRRPAATRPSDLVRAALIIPHVEHPRVAREATLAEFDRLGRRASERLAALGDRAGALDRVAALNVLLFDEEGFSGNEARYDDPRNSFLDDVVRGAPASRSRSRWSTWKSRRGPGSGSKA